MDAIAQPPAVSAVEITLPTGSEPARLRKVIRLEVPAGVVWDAVRDFGAVHTRLAPGFLTAGRLDESGARVLTFFNGATARETLVSLDDRAMRLVYAIPEGPFSTYQATAQVTPEGLDASRFTWTIELLPAEMAGYVAGMMDEAAPIMKRTLERR